jgi:hypothetical protein
LRGDKIQSIVTEKSDVTDIRSASIIDFAYLIVLFVFKEMSNVPMSTTWVFIGLLGGRELAMRLSARVTKKVEAEGTMSLKTTVLMVVKDLSYATIGLIVSIVMAIAINDSLQDEILEWFR